MKKILIFIAAAAFAAASYAKGNSTQNYSVLPLPIKYSEAIKLLPPPLPDGANDSKSSYETPSAKGYTYLLNILSEAQAANLLSKISKDFSVHLHNTNDLSVSVEDSSDDTRDLKISGPPWNGRDMDTFISVYTTQTVVMASSSGSSDGRYRVFLVSPELAEQGAAANP